MPLRVSRILHAGYLFECERTRIVFDPILENPFSQNCFAHPSVEFDLEHFRKTEFSAIFISHHHDDHCSFESLQHFNRKTPIHMYCVYPEMFEMLRTLGFDNIHSLELGVPVQVGAIEITPHRALDVDVDSLFEIRAAGMSVLNVVDSWIDEPTMDCLAKLAPWDLVLWPFQTLREVEVLCPRHSQPATQGLPWEWIDQLQRLKPRFTIASSCQFVHERWSWYNQALFPISYSEFQSQVETQVPGTQVLRLNPSCSISISEEGISSAERIPWIKTIGDQNVDYKYDSEIEIPSTAAIARHFPAISAPQAQSVDDYCRHELVKKYRALPKSEESFMKNLSWLLTVYDQNGEATQYRYRIEEHEMKVVSDIEFKANWTTDIALFKLHAAREAGESFTSLYLRINDGICPIETKEKLKDVDPLEDPLVRCLFSKSFGSFQQAQLEKIQSRKS